MVYLVLELLEAGVKPEKIYGKDYYPRLNKNHIRAALQYAAHFAKYQEFVSFDRQPA